MNKQLNTAMSDMGFVEPKEVQEKTLSRIIGGQDLVVIGPEGCGKTTAMILGVLAKLKYAFEIAPRAMIMVPNKDKGLELEEQFRFLGKNLDIRVLGVYPGAGMEGQRELLEDGIDVVIGTPDRIEALYIKSAVNLTQLKTFILDDADLIVKQGLQTVVKNISESLPKCQHIVFTEVMHEKLEKLIHFFLVYPTTIEVNLDSEHVLSTVDLQLFKVPNYKTKLNLLNLMMRDYDIYKKVVVFSNSKVTSDKLLKSLEKRIEGAVAIFNPSYSQKGFTSFEQFKQDENVRVLLLSNEEEVLLNLDDIGHILHFDLPADRTIFINRVERKQVDELPNTVAITYATDIELNMVRKIELGVGHSMEIMELPVDLVIEGNRGGGDEEEKVVKKKKTTIEEYIPGAAFHAKKESNLKDYNYNYKDKRKMAGKKSKRRDS
ncbi:DEAD/DEAH box helicase [Cytophaga hutchinsonii]|uniref:DEAD/DEAH box helicase n=1 Tax=Cytophaga hutchinsonii TaxID=985 RepID=UPI001EE4D9C6|nr:DEAD/DEAH box helicase [Cytophaga hutchinsonii]